MTAINMSTQARAKWVLPRPRQVMGRRGELKMIITEAEDQGNDHAHQFADLHTTSIGHFLPISRPPNAGRCDLLQEVVHVLRVLETLDVYDVKPEPFVARQGLLPFFIGRTISKW